MISCDAYGFVIQFTWDAEYLEEIVNSVLLPDWLEVHRQKIDVHYHLEGRKRSVWIHRDQTELLGGLTPESSVDVLRREVQLHLATYCPGYLFVHAGVVACTEGVVMIPGRTYSGKSVLVRALLDQGYTYFSDEYALVSPEGLIAPFPRPLRVRTGPHCYKFTKACRLGWTPETAPQKPHLLLCTSFVPESNWRPQQISPATALLKLLEHTVAARIDPVRALSHLKALLSHHPRCLDGPRGEAVDTVRELKQTGTLP